MFTSNEMITAIATGTVNAYMEDRFERAAFAEYLTEEYGTGAETATETLTFLKEGTIWYEDGVVSYLYRDLMEFRNTNQDELEYYNRLVNE